MQACRSFGAGKYSETTFQLTRASQWQQMVRNHATSLYSNLLHKMHHIHSVAIHWHTQFKLWKAVTLLGYKLSVFWCWGECLDQDCTVRVMWGPFMAGTNTYNQPSSLWRRLDMPYVDRNIWIYSNISEQLLFIQFKCIKGLHFALWAKLFVSMRYEWEMMNMQLKNAFVIPVNSNSSLRLKHLKFQADIYFMLLFIKYI